MTDTPPASLGGYTLVSLIGRGGMGEVWRAERVGAGGVRRRAAVKRILPAFQRDPVLRERFVAEARITSRLEHPNIVQVLHFDDQPEPYLVLEYVDGVSVNDLLQRGARGENRFPLAAALYIVAEAADALDYAHRRTDESQRPLDIVHRDVSPPNILVSFDGAVKVNDFGVARAADNIVRTQAGLSVGKIVYMAPEQALGETVDRRADVFALGIVLWELLTLRPLMPRTESPAAMLEMLQRCQFPAPSSLATGVPASVDAIVREALARDPQVRTASAGRMAKALRMALHEVAPGFDRRDLANVVRDTVPELATQSTSERGTSGGSARDAKLEPAPAVVSSSAPGAVASVNPTGVAASVTMFAGSPAQRPNDPQPPLTRERAGTPPAPLTEPAAPPFAPRPPDVATLTNPKRRRNVVLSGLLAVALLAGLGVGAWFMFQPDSAPAGTSSNEALNQSLRESYQSMIPPLLPACTSYTAGSSPHGTIRASVAFQPSGVVQSVDVMVNGNASTPDAAVAQCVESYMTTWRGPVTAAGTSLDNLTATY